MHNKDLLLVNNSFNGFPDAMRVDLDCAMGLCQVAELNGEADWLLWVSTADHNDELPCYSDKPEAKFACYYLANDDPDDKYEENTSILATMNLGVRARREDYGPLICVDAGNGGEDYQHIRDLLEAHTQVAQNLNVHPDWFAVVDPSSKMTNSVTLVYKGFGDEGYDHCPVPTEWAAEVLRWLGIRFCRWREWDELMELETAVEDEDEE